MIYPAILIASIVLLVAFAIERLSSKRGIPSVIVMVLAGIIAKPLLASRGYAVAGIETAVPIIGTIGLILIVLEGALDIELRRERMKTALGALTLALTGFVVCVGVFSVAAVYALALTPFQAVVLAVPFAVISSAVAIPSSSFLPAKEREFVVYESSISDIIGVIVFIALLNSNGTLRGSLLGLAGGGLISLLLSVVCAVGLMLVLVRIDGHIRFIPLLAGLFGLYAAGKLMHLSPLIMVLLFGLALNNPKLITRIKPLRNWIDDRYDVTLKEFKVLVLEFTFAVRGFFFILLGYWTDLADIASLHAWAAALLILVVLYTSRHFALKASRHSHAGPLTWLAPRGLITILLFLSAKEVFDLPAYLNGTVVIVVLISSGLIALSRIQAKAQDRATEAAEAAVADHAEQPPATDSQNSLSSAKPESA